MTWVRPARSAASRATRTGTHTHGCQRPSARTKAATLEKHRQHRAAIALRGAPRTRPGRRLRAGDELARSPVQVLSSPALPHRPPTPGDGWTAERVNCPR
jgi:hypothetical protein